MAEEFDPDAYLKKKEKEFNPDDYLMTHGVDKEKGYLETAMDYAPEALSTVGGLIGAGVGLPTTFGTGSIPLAAAGAGAGMMLGKSIQNIYKQGSKHEDLSEEQILEPIVDGLVTGTLTLVGGNIINNSGKAIAYVGKNYGGLLKKVAEKSGNVAGSFVGLPKAGTWTKQGFGLLKNAIGAGVEEEAAVGSSNAAKKTRIDPFKVIKSFKKP